MLCKDTQMKVYNFTAHKQLAKQLSAERRGCKPLASCLVIEHASADVRVLLLVLLTNSALTSWAGSTSTLAYELKILQVTQATSFKVIRNYTNEQAR